MEHHLLSPLLEVLAKERRTEPEDYSAANIVAYRMLRGDYLEPTYADHHLAEIAPGEWRLFQAWRGDFKARDPLITFHDDCYMDEDEEEEDKWFRIDGRPQTIQSPVAIHGEQGIAPQILARADALLERVREHDPSAMQRLLAPTEEQQRKRHDISIRVVDGQEMGNALAPLLGPAFDGSLKSYGIEYHSFDHYSHKSVYLVACNEDEVAGVLKLGANQDWSYVLSYVSVAPGFRGMGLSKRLYAQALELCERDQRVFVRSQPGDFTREKPDITVGYDKMVKQSPVLHADSESPFLYLIEKSIERGMDYAQMLERYKSHCDAAIPTPQERQAKMPPTWQEREIQRKQVQALLEANAAEPAPDLPSKPSPRRSGP